MTESVDQGDLLWQVEQLREQNLKILGRWQEEKRRADEAARQLAVATRDAEMAKGNAENCYQRWYGAYERNLELERRLAEAREIIGELLGYLEIASVMPGATGKAYAPDLSSDFMGRARATLRTES